jgi:Raf kinase inhibitor-like YbhB/YbcL family protein
MKKTIMLVCLIFSATIVFGQKTFTLKSSNLEGQATAAEEYIVNGYNGKNQSPQLSWVNPPAGTKSFAITVYDPDAPTGSGWWHWLAYNIPANINELAAGAGDTKAKVAPEGMVQSMTDFGFTGYGGPCPPANTGIHQYIVTVYALKTADLGLKSTTIPPVVGATIRANTIAKASLVFYDGRP